MPTIYHYDFFFSHLDYYLSHGKGFSVYNVTPNVWQDFHALCQEKNISCSTLRLSESSSLGFKILDPPAITVIIQDLSLDEFRKKGNYLADKVIFPLWYNHRSICFFSLNDETEYSKNKISSGDIHTNFDGVVNTLLTEQVATLLSRFNYTFSSPRFLDLDPNKTILTPIEQHFAMALEKAGLDYKSQVRLGRFFVDFLVDAGNQKVIVECDGRAYHDPKRDV